MNDELILHPLFRQATALFILFAGLAIGSFLNVCIYRIPLRRSIIWPASACPGCGRPIAWYENIPVLSWLALRGRCRGCRVPISVQYPLVEMLTGLLFLLAYLSWGLSIDLPFILVYFCLLIVIAGIDIKAQIVPHVLTIPGILLGLLYGYLAPQRMILEAVAGLLLGGGSLLLVIVLFYIATKKIGMGGGDVMILAMIGAYLGPVKLPPVLFIASVGGIAFFILMRLVFKRRRIADTITTDDIKGTESDLERVIYFGPFLAIGGIAMLFADRFSWIHLVAWW